MPETTHEDLISVRSAMDNYLAWFQQTLEQPYTVSEMVANLYNYLCLHFWYYSNNPDQAPEKLHRIFAIENRLRQDFFSRTRVFSAGLAVAENKSDQLKSEIALYEYPFLFYMQGRYYNDGFEMVIPNTMMMLVEYHSPYFEFVFDEDMEIKKESGGEDFFRFLTDVYYLHFLYQTLANVESAKTGDVLAFAGNTVEPKFDSFEYLFKVKEDFKRVVEFLKSRYLLDENGAFVDLSGNKKFFAVLYEVLKNKSRLKPAYHAEVARLMKQQFNIPSLSTDYLSKDFSNRQELVEEMMRDLRF